MFRAGRLFDDKFGRVCMCFPPITLEMLQDPDLFRRFAKLIARIHETTDDAVFGRLYEKDADFDFVNDTSVRPSAAPTCNGATPVLFFTSGSAPFSSSI